MSSSEEIQNRVIAQNTPDNITGSTEKERAVRQATIQKQNERTEAEVPFNQLVGDIANTAAGFATTFLQGFTGLADVITQPSDFDIKAAERLGLPRPPSLEEAFGVNEALGNVRQDINEALASDKTKVQQEFVQQQAQRFNLSESDLRNQLLGQGLTPEQVDREVELTRFNDPYLLNTNKEADTQKYLEAGYGEGIASLLAETENLGKVITDRLDNPRALATEAVESSASIVGAGLVGALTKKAFTANLRDQLKDPKKVERALQSKTVRDALAKAQERTALSFIAGSEGGNAASDIKSQILKTDFDELMVDSPRYRELVEDMSPEDARSTLAQESSNLAFVLQASAAGVISKVTGTDKLTSKLFTPGTRTGDAFNSGIARITASGLSETVEEGLQGASGNTVQNLSESIAFGDRTVDLTDNLSEATGASIVSGGLSGTALATVTNTPKLLKEARSATAKSVGAVGNIPTKVKETLSKSEIDKIVAEGRTDEVVDNTKSTYDPTTAINTMLHSANRPTKKEDMATYADQLEKHIYSLQDELRGLASKAAQEEEQNGKPNRETIQKLNSSVSLLNKKAIPELNKIYAATASITKEEVKDQVKSEDTEEVKRAFGTMLTRLDQFTTQEIQDLQNTGNFTDQQKEQLNILVRLKKADQVNKEILVGGGNNIGVLQYVKGISRASRIGDNETALNQLSQFKRFALNQNAKLQSLDNIIAQQKQGKDITQLVEEHSTKFPSLSGKPLQAGNPRQLANLRKLIAEDTKAVNEGYVLARGIYQAGLPTETTTQTQERDVPAPAQEENQPEVVPVKQVKPETTTETVTQEVDPVDIAFDNIIDPNTKQSVVVKAAVKAQIGKRKLSEAQLNNVLIGLSAGVQDAINNQVSPTVTNKFYKAGIALARENKLVNTFSLAKSVRTNRKQGGKFRSVTTQIPAKTLVQKQPDVLNSVVLDENIQKEYGLTESEVQALESLKPFVGGFIQNFDKVVRQIDKQFVKDSGALQYLFREDGAPLSETNPDMLTALAIQSLDYMYGNLSAPFRSYDDVSAALGYDQQFRLPYEYFDILKDKGQLKANVTRSLGRQAMRTLGIKATNGTVENSLSLGLGTAMANTLVSMGLLELNAIPTAEYLSMKFDKTTTVGTESLVYFYAPKKKEVDGETVLDDQVETVIEPLRENIRLTQKLLGSTNIKFPSTTPPEIKTSTMKGTIMKLGKRVTEIRNKHSNRPVRLKTETLPLIDNLDQDVLEQIFGYEPDLNSLHITERSAAGVVNDNVRRTLKNFQDFRKSLPTEDTAFYLTSEVWKNLRMGIADSALNPNANKIVRHLITMESQIVTINKTDKAAMDNFYLALAEPFDVKVDKLKPEVAIQKVQAILDTPKVRMAIAAIADIKNGTNTRDNQQAILEAVQELGEGAFSFDALIAVEAFINSTGNTFETSLFREVDGITNGVIIGTLLFAAGNSVQAVKDILKKGGLFTDYTTYADLLEQGELDLYQSLAHTVTTKLSGLPDALQKLVGDITDDMGNVTSIGRNLFKNPLMVTIYGSSIEGVMEHFTNSIIENLYADVRKAVNKGDQATLDAINSNLAQTLNVRDRVGFTLKHGMNRTLDDLYGKDATQRFKNVIINSYQDAIQESIEDMFGDFIAKRNVLNQGIQMVFEGFNVIHEAELDKAEKKNGGALNQQQYDEFLVGLMKYIPTVAHALSTDKSEHLMMMKPANVPDYGKGKRVDTISNVPLARTTFNNNVPSVDTIKTINTYPTRKTWESPGVGVTIGTIHGFDAATMLQTLDTEEVLNIFDAIGIPLNSVEKATHKINKEFFELARNYSPMREGTKSAMNSMAAILNYVKDKPELAEKIRKNVVKTYKGKERKARSNNPLDVMYKDMINTMRSTARSIDQEKNQIMDDILHVAQYNNNVNGYEPFEENTATVTEEDIVDFLTDYQNYQPGVGITEEGKQTDFYKENQAEVTKFTTRIFGSSFDNTIDPNNFGASFTATVNPDEVMMHFDRLSTQGNVSVTQAHTDHLKSVISNMIENVIKPFNYQERTTGNENYGLLYGEDVYLNVAQNMPESVLSMSAQETYTHELLHAVSKFGIDNFSALSRELKRIYRIVDSVVTWEDFLPTGLSETDPTYAKEVERAKATYAYIFRNTSRNADGKNNYLHEFFVYGLTNEKFMEILSLPKVQAAYSKRFDAPKMDKLPLMTRMVVLLQNMLDRMYEYIVFGSAKRSNTINQQMYILGQRIAKQQLRFNTTGSITGRYQNIVDNFAVGTIQRFITAPIYRLLQNDKFINNKYTPVRVISKSILTFYDMDMTKVNKVVRQVAKRMRLSKDNIITTVMTEMNVNGQSNVNWEEMVRKTKRDVDTLRDATTTAYSDFLRNAFYTDVSDEQQIEMTEVLLRTDLSSLLNDDNSNIVEVLDYLRNKDKRNKRIERLTQELQKKKHGNYYINQAENTAYFLVHERSLYDNLMLNATNIVNMVGTKEVPETGKATIEKTVDELITLRALNMLSEDKVASVASLVQDEFGQNDSINGITVLLNLHKEFKTESKDKLFNNETRHTEKGYIAEITNPNIDFIVAPETSEARLAQDNYVAVSGIRGDVDQTTLTRGLKFYVNKFGGLARWNSGAASLTSKRSKGTSIYQYYSNLNMQDSVAQAGKEVRQIQTNKRGKIASLFTDKPVKVSEKHTALIPVVGRNDDVADYRYIMDKATRDNVLERNLRVFDVFGSMQASIGDKLKTTERNREVVKLAHDEFQAASASDLEEFVEISANSPNEEYRELWHMLPDDMKADVRSIFGEDAMYINEHMLHIILGFRQYSFFTKPPAVNPDISELANRTIGNYITEVFKQMIGVKNAQRAEQFWLDLVALSKSNIVIRFVDTLVANILSNFVVLKAFGVGNRELSRNFTVGIAAARQHQKKSMELEQLKIAQKAYGTSVGREAQIRRLENELATNPVKDLIDAGLYTTIVDDVQMLDERYAYKNSIETLLDPIAKRTPDKLRSVFDILFMTNNSAPYKFLNDTTKLSDFVARFTLHQNNLNKGMTKEESIKMISKVFINYDVNSGRYVDAMNRFGLVLFTKFFFRIQQVILTLWRERPASQLGILMAQDLFLGEVSDINDSLMLINGGINFNLNPLELLDPVLQIPLAEAVLH